jgi:hypothetical protein
MRCSGGLNTYFAHDAFDIAELVFIKQIDETRHDLAHGIAIAMVLQVKMLDLNWRIAGARKGGCENGVNPRNMFPAVRAVRATDISDSELERVDLIVGQRGTQSRVLRWGGEQTEPLSRLCVHPRFELARELDHRLAYLKTKFDAGNMNGRSYRITAGSDCASKGILNALPTLKPICVFGGWLFANDFFNDADDRTCLPQDLFVVLGESFAPIATANAFALLNRFAVFAFVLRVTYDF